MDVTTPTPIGNRSQPTYLKQAEALAKEVTKMKRAALKTTLGVSNKLADLNYDRFQSWSTDTESGRQAIYSYCGDAYVGLDGFRLDPEDIHTAQDCLVILSGLYGVLRPLDAIHPYRLEMGGRFSPSRHKNLLTFWKPTITRYLQSRLKNQATPWVLNLASKEYSNTVDFRSMNMPTISPQFLEMRDGEVKMISSFAKKARGLMTRWAIQTQVKDPTALREFSKAGYSYRSDRSTPESPVFVR